MKNTDPIHRRALPVPAAALALLAVAAAFSCDRSSRAASYPTTLAVAADDPWVGPAIGEPSLVDSGGRRVTRVDLAGSPLILDFVFTTCTGPCPAMSAGMRSMQDDLEGTDVRLVSVSVDPERDDPEALAAYAEALGADPERWWFLTGEAAEIAAFARSLSLAADPVPDPAAELGTQVSHSTKYVVIDGDGHVRGYYDGKSEEGRAGAVARARHLAD